MHDAQPLLVIGNHTYSSWSLRAWFFLTAIGYDFEVERIPLDTEEHARRIGEYSPTGRVPVLHVGDEVIWDSLAICQEIVERFAPERGYPAAPAARALARSMVAEMHSGFADLRNQLPMNCRASDRTVAMTEATQRDVARVCALWRQARALHAYQGPWLFGTFGIADAFYAPVVARFRTYAVPVGEVEGAFMDTVLGHPAMQRWYRLAAAETEVIEREERGA